MTLWQQNTYVLNILNDNEAQVEWTLYESKAVSEKNKRFRTDKALFFNQ